MTTTPIVLSIDLDGTLLIEEREVHPEDVHLLHHPLPVTLILATGRSLESARRVLERAGLYRHEPLPFPLVLQNGAAIYRPQEVLEDYFPIPPEAEAQLHALAPQFSEAALLWQGLDGAYLEEITPFGLQAAERFGFLPRPLSEAPAGLGFGKLMCLSDRPEVLKAFAAATRHLPVEGSYSLDVIYEVTRQGVHKGFGLRTLLQRLGLTHARLVAVGDGDNDVPMFSCADLAIAPLNASPLARSHAHRLIDRRPHGLLTPVLDLLRQEGWLDP